MTQQHGKAMFSELSELNLSILIVTITRTRQVTTELLVVEK